MLASISANGILQQSLKILALNEMINQRIQTGAPIFLQKLLNFCIGLMIKNRYTHKITYICLIFTTFNNNFFSAAKSNSKNKLSNNQASISICGSCGKRKFSHKTNDWMCVWMMKNLYGNFTIRIWFDTSVFGGSFHVYLKNQLN